MYVVVFVVVTVIVIDNVYMYIYMYINLYICIYIYIHIHIYTEKLEKNAPETSQSFIAKSSKSTKTTELLNPSEFSLKKSEKSMNTMVASEVEKQSQDLQNDIELFDNHADDVRAYVHIYLYLYMYMYIYVYIYIHISIYI
jgi:hypothetical protein